MSEEITKLAEEGLYDHVIIECSAVQEPMQICESFTFDSPMMSENASDLKDVAKVDTCVTVIDCTTFKENLKSSQIASDMYEDIEPTEDRSVLQLMCDQIEFSNVIVLTKCGEKF